VLDKLPATNLAGLERVGPSLAPEAEPETPARLSALPALAVGAAGMSPTAPPIGGRRDHSIVDTLRRRQAKSDQVDARKDSTGGRRGDVLGGLRRASARQLAPAIGDRRNPASHTLRRTIIRDAGSQRQALTEAEVVALVREHPTRAQEILEAYASSDEYSYVSTRRGLTLNKQRPLQPRNGGGGMYGRISGQNSATPGWDHLVAAAEIAATEGDIEKKKGGVETYGQKPVPVKNVSKKRVAQHKKKWKADTGDESARAHVLRTVGDELANSFDWDITHLAGWAQAGPSADTMNHNLVAASDHANTEMMFFDDLITGNREVIVKTSAEVYAGTLVAKSIHMEFVHVDAPDRPFFTHDVSGLRPKISPDEAAELRARAHYEITATLDSLAALVSMPQIHNSQSNNNTTTAMTDSDSQGGMMQANSGGT
jgi:hypothetical protein